MSVPIRYFLKRLPPDDQELERLAQALGVSMPGTAITWAGHSGTVTYEVQRESGKQSGMQGIPGVGDRYRF